ncbi:unnamed protein product [Penicillium glandicola]
MPYAPTVFRENGRDVLEPYESGPGLRWITVKLSDGDRHLCDADLMRMVIERLQDEEVMVHSESNNQAKKPLEMSFPVVDSSSRCQQWIDIVVEIAKSYRDGIVAGRIFIDHDYVFGLGTSYAASLPRFLLQIPSSPGI